LGRRLLSVSYDTQDIAESTAPQKRNCFPAQCEKLRDQARGSIELRNDPIEDRESFVVTTLDRPDVCIDHLVVGRAVIVAQPADRFMGGCERSGVVRPRAVVENPRSGSEETGASGEQGIF